MALPGGSKIYTPTRTTPGYGISTGWKAVLSTGEQCSAPFYLTESFVSVGLGRLHLMGWDRVQSGKKCFLLNLFSGKRINEYGPE